MMYQELKLTEKKSLDFYILFYLFHNLNVPFNVKTILFTMKRLGYQKNYLAMTVSKLSKLRYLSEPDLGIYMMTDESYKTICELNPSLAKEIKVNLHYQEQ